MTLGTSRTPERKINIKIMKNVKFLVTIKLVAKIESIGYCGLNTKECQMKRGACLDQIKLLVKLDGINWTFPHDHSSSLSNFDRIS